MPLSNQIPSSRLIQPGVVDSAATRPASPFEGQCIFQKDTDQLLVWNGTAWVIPNSTTQNPMGLELITSGSLSTNTTNFNNVFTSVYRNYLVSINVTSGSVNNEVYLRLCSGGTPQDSGTLYRYTAVGTRTDTNATSNDSGIANQIPAVFISSSAHAASQINVMQPQMANNTFINSDWFYDDGGVGIGRRVIGRHNSNTQFDGIRIYSSNAFTGFCSIYGYRI